MLVLNVVAEAHGLMLMVPFCIRLGGVELAGVDLPSQTREVPLDGEWDPHQPTVFLKLDRPSGSLRLLRPHQPHIPDMAFFLGIDPTARAMEDLGARRHVYLHDIALIPLVYLQLFFRIVVGETPLTDEDRMLVMCN